MEHLGGDLATQQGVVARACVDGPDVGRRAASAVRQPRQLEGVVRTYLTHNLRESARNLLSPLVDALPLAGG